MTVRPLSLKNLADLPEHVIVPSYERGAIRAGIAHIGVGNFHRAHQAFYIDQCLHLADHSQWGILGINLGAGPNEDKLTELFEQQNNLYTLSQFSPDNKRQTRVIGSIVGYLYAPDDPERVLQRLSNPAIRIVSLTITEGGYNQDATGAFLLDDPQVQHDLATPTRPKSAFGYVVEALDRRRQAGHPPFTIMSCDNLCHNGDVARRSFIAFARARSAELAEWIEANVTFPISMVDRITPSVSPAMRLRIVEETGIDDHLPVVTEQFSQWVIEDKFVAGRPSLETVGVELRPDVKAYESVKMRLLNASHMMLSYPALLAGYRKVDDALQNTELYTYLDRFMEEDVFPSLTAPEGVSLTDYKNRILQRFQNPAIGDQLLRIAHNGVAKIPVYLSQTMRNALERSGSFERIALLLASFHGYFSGLDDDGQRFDVEEPHLSPEDQRLLNSRDPLAILKIAPFADLRLYDNAKFVETFTRMRETLQQRGALFALSHLDQVLLVEDTH